MSVGVPVAATLACPRCKIIQSFVNVDGGTTFRCSGCEWYWTLSTQAPSGTISHAGGVAIGDTVLIVASGGGF